MLVFGAVTRFSSLFFEIRKKFQGFFFSGVDTESQPLENVCLGGSQMTQQDGVQSTSPHT